MVKIFFDEAMGGGLTPTNPPSLRHCFGIGCKQRLQSTLVDHVTYERWDNKQTVPQVDVVVVTCCL